ncbi:asparagine synthetase [glutamine-hydrolyzing] 1 [Holospora elegans E1]|uniref:asparagine synthase (glutamine-hydrolyzing) n=1 Tax=Holospora elegans E1 TaxID=1427503 RepID=A0A023DWI1_9PROT|nr:asparagine synthase (glutamine-hydrolyzing) [Holospora elegans]GAJ45773.1 asparagine synthetase [glutamine-hydrolyzing] 1 [Holospora elegans E1]
MCGIVGLWDTKRQWALEFLQTFIVKVSNALSHRGPDDCGMWSDEASGIVLAHRRLAVLDLSPSGHQPMRSASGRYIIIYNGEIYNFLDYRGEFPFLKGKSDTEVLLEACEAWGPVEACRRFRGMFAFALWDTFDRVLFLARDRVGEKPLYWGKVGTMIVFTSELKALHHCPGWKGTLCQKALSSYLQLGYVIDPLAIYEGFQKIVPGTVLEISSKGTETVHCFWDHHTLVRNSVLSTDSTQEALEKLEDLLLDNVERRMICDVSVGAFLSGGIDSGLVTAMMQHLQKKRAGDAVRSFSIGFDVRAYNEASNAEAVACHIGTQHKTIYMTGRDALDVLSQAYWDEPFSDSSQLATAFLCKQAKNHQVTVCLSGDGGDESFAGYTRYLATEVLLTRLNKIPLWLRKMVSVIGMHTPWICHRYGRIRKAIQVLPINDLLELYKEICTQYPVHGVWKSHLLGVPFPEDRLWHSVASMQYWDILTYLPGDILTKVDRASMAYSLEVRTPFLDKTVIEYGWTLPMHHRIYKGQPKYLLRKLASKWIPKFVTQDKKMGFGVPLAHWLRKDLRSWMESLLTPQSLESAGFNAKAIQNFWKLHLKRKADYSNRLWNTAMFLYWNKSKEKI